MTDCPKSPGTILGEISVGDVSPNRPTDEQHEQLAEVLHGLRGMVIVSGYRCDLYDRLYEGWRMHERIAHADGARRRVEVLWISPNVPARAGELFERLA
jgi:DNA adenine methylase